MPFKSCFDQMDIICWRFGKWMIYLKVWNVSNIFSSRLVPDPRPRTPKQSSQKKRYSKSTNFRPLLSLSFAPMFCRNPMSRGPNSKPSADFSKDLCAGELKPTENNSSSHLWSQPPFQQRRCPHETQILTLGKLRADSVPQLFLKVHNRLQWSSAREGSGRIERPLQVPRSLIFFLETNNGPRNDLKSKNIILKGVDSNFMCAKGCRFKLSCVKLYLFLILFCFLHHSSFDFLIQK